MLQDAPYHFRLIGTLILTVVLTMLLCLAVKKLLGRLKPIRSMTAVTWLLALSVGLTWLVSMGCLTVVTTQEIYDQLYAASDDFTSYVNLCGRFSDFYSSEDYKYEMRLERPDMLENFMLDAIAMNTSGSLGSCGWP